jgi:Tfp pilus assembly protein PilF
LTTDLSASLEKLLARGQDSATLRFALGTEYLKQEQPELAIKHLRAAIEMDLNYSAAWKLLGKAQVAAGLQQEAQTTFTQGIAIARARGDEQAVREMQVFLRRLETSS